MPWKWNTASETPWMALERYALACAQQFDEDTASDEQADTLIELNEAIKAAQKANNVALNSSSRFRRTLLCNTTVKSLLGIAIGGFETYIEKYDIHVPDAPN